MPSNIYKLAIERLFNLFKPSSDYEIRNSYSEYAIDASKNSIDWLSRYTAGLVHSSFKINITDRDTKSTLFSISKRHS